MNLVRFLFIFALFSSSLYSVYSLSYKGYDMPKPCDVFYYPKICGTRDPIISCYNCYGYNDTNKEVLLRECAVVFDNETLEKYPQDKWNCTLREQNDNENTFHSIKNIQHSSKIYHICNETNCLGKRLQNYSASDNNHLCITSNCIRYKDIVICDTNEYCREEL